MKINFTCENCGVILVEFNHSESLALAEEILKYGNDLKILKIPFCKDCANRYMYSNGTMKEELARVSASNHESALG